VAVFATYEGMIEHFAPASIIEDTTEENDIQRNDVSDDSASSDSREDENETNSSQPQVCNDTNESNDAMDRATLKQHVLAGAMGGAAHAVLSLGLEVKLSVSNDGLTVNAGTGVNHRTFIANTLASKHVHLQVPVLNYSVPYIFHHSLAHSVLFGSYQLTKRLLLQQLPDSTKHSPNHTGYNNDTVHIAAIAVAGGLAGQFQHIISHFSEQWLGLADYNETKHSSSSSLLRRFTLASWPTWRSTMMAFPPSAIGFLAFEYGKLMMDGGEDLAMDD